MAIGDLLTTTRPDLSGSIASSSNEIARQAQLEAQMLAQLLANQRTLAGEAGAQRATDLADIRTQIEQQNRDAAERARLAREYATGRAGRADEVRAAVDSAFAPYDDSFLDQFVNDYRSFYAPQVGRQFDDALEQVTYDLSRRGLLRSSVAGDRVGDLTEARTRAESEIGNRAVSERNALRDRLGQARSGFLEQGLSAAVLGDPVLPEGLSGVQQPIADIDRRVGEFRQTVSSQAPAVAGGVTNTPVADIFGSVLGTIGDRVERERSSEFVRGGLGAYPSYNYGTGGGSSRVVR